MNTKLLALTFAVFAISLLSAVKAQDLEEILNNLDPNSPFGEGLIDSVLSTCADLDECCIELTTFEYFAENCDLLGVTQNCSILVAEACPSLVAQLGLSASDCCPSGLGGSASWFSFPTPIQTGTPSLSVSDDPSVSTTPTSSTQSASTDNISTVPTTASVFTTIIGVSDASTTPSTSSDPSTALTGSVSTPTGLTANPIPLSGFPDGSFTILPSDIPTPSTSAVATGLAHVPDPWQCQGNILEVEPCCMALRICSLCSYNCFNQGGGKSCWDDCEAACIVSLEDWGFPEGQVCCCPPAGGCN